jgi:hypothetical protein
VEGEDVSDSDRVGDGDVDGGLLDDGVVEPVAVADDEDEVVSEPVDDRVGVDDADDDGEGNVMSDSGIA